MPRLWEGWQVIEFGVLSISLLVGTAQGLVLALMLWRAPANRAANRWLALLILAVSALITPYIIGFAGFYDRWPWLSFTPLSYTLAFGPLLWLYATTLCGRPQERAWPHFAPFAVQFAADALVFPFPLETKDWWDTVAHAPIIAPMLRVATFISLAVYGRLAWRCWADYRRWLGFFIANVRDPSRNYFDQFWLYVIFSGLVIYLGVEGWRHAGMRYPVPADAVEEAVPAGRDWAALGARFEAEIEAKRLWRDPDLTAASLARALGTNSNYLARAFNEGLGANFNTVINRRRVRQVQAWLADPADTRAILTMAMDAGFRSKASFNRAFAEFAGMTPTQARSSQARLKS